MDNNKDQDNTENSETTKAGTTTRKTTTRYKWKNTSTTDLVEVGVEAGWEAIGGIIGDWTCAIHKFGKQYDDDDNDDGDDEYQDDHT